MNKKKNHHRHPFPGMKRRQIDGLKAVQNHDRAHQDHVDRIKQARAAMTRHLTEIHQLQVVNDRFLKADNFRKADGTPAPIQEPRYFVQYTLPDGSPYIVKAEISKNCGVLICPECGHQIYLKQVIRV